jgi:hypothetical protein
VQWLQEAGREGFPQGLDISELVESVIMCALKRNFGAMQIVSVVFSLSRKTYLIDRTHTQPIVLFMLDA